MPTKKPRIQAIVDTNDYYKFKILCKKENRSESNLSGLMIKKYIEDYEAEHGEIHVPDQEK